MLKDAMGGYRGTVTEISRIIIEQPDNAEAWYNRGMHGAVAENMMAPSGITPWRSTLDCGFVRL